MPYKYFHRRTLNCIIIWTFSVPPHSTCCFRCWIHRMITVSHYIMTKIIHCCTIAIYAIIKAKAFKCVIYKTNYIRMRLSEIRSNSLQHVSIYSSSEEHLGDSGNLHSSVAQITALLKPYVSEFVCKAVCVCEDVSPQMSRLCKRCMRRWTGRHPQTQSMHLGMWLWSGARNLIMSIYLWVSGNRILSSQSWTLQCHFKHV